MRILIMGAGAIGTAVGGFMAKAGHHVTLVGRQAHMDAIRDHGLRITGIWGDHHVTQIHTQTTPDTLQPGFDLIIITVKSYDTAHAINAVRHLITRDTLVCSYQNGLGNAETIAAAIGWPQTIGARAIYGAWLPQPGTAEITVIANPTAIGEYTSETPVARVRQIVQAMADAGLPTVHTGKIATVLWAKVAYNCALNPLSALLDVPYGDLAQNPHTRDIMAGIIHELYAVANAMKVTLEPDTPGDYLQLLLNHLIPPTAAHYASMREDLRRARRTEIDALNGAICQFAESHNIQCPINTTLTQLIHAKEK